MRFFGHLSEFRIGRDSGSFHSCAFISGYQFAVFILHEPIFASFRVDSPSSWRVVEKWRRHFRGTNRKFKKTINVNSDDADVRGGEFIVMRDLDVGCYRRASARGNVCFSRGIGDERNFSDLLGV